LQNSTANQPTPQNGSKHFLKPGFTSVKIAALATSGVAYESARRVSQRLKGTLQSGTLRYRDRVYGGVMSPQNFGQRGT